MYYSHDIYSCAPLHYLTVYEFALLFTTYRLTVVQFLNCSKTRGITHMIADRSREYGDTIAERRRKYRDSVSGGRRKYRDTVSEIQ